MLDPHAQRLRRVLAMGKRPETDLAGRRAGFAALLALAATEADASGVGVAEHAVPGGPRLRCYAPAATPAPAPGLVFLHGGGFVCGDLETHDKLCRALAAGSRCRVIAVAYRLAPEHPFPAAAMDAEATVDWVLEHAAALGLDPARIGLVGESAGATLAVAAALRVATTRPNALALQVLLCPILDWAAAGRAPDDELLVDPATIAHDLACYLPQGQDPADPRVSPLRADSFAGLPPALLHTAECDPLRADGQHYAERLRAAGVPVRHACHPGMPHLFHALGRAIPAARTALGRIAAELGAAMGQSPCRNT